MMKIIKYQRLIEANHGTEDKPNIVQTFHACEIQCSDETFESNFAIAKSEAYNGEVTVDEVTEPEPVSAEEQMRADIDYLAIMTGVEL